MIIRYQVIPRLNKILKSRGITQTQLSMETGIPQGTISKFDKNKQHLDEHLVTISKVLDIPIEDLFEINRTVEKAPIPDAPNLPPIKVKGDIEGTKFTVINFEDKLKEIEQKPGGQELLQLYFDLMESKN